MSGRYLTTAEFAQLAGISAQMARKAIVRARAGKPWNGILLVAEPVTGLRGGAAGQSYVVHTDSLPLDLQERLKERSSIIERPFLQNAADHRTKKSRWLHLILTPALMTMPRSPERRAAIDGIVSRPLTNWDGEPYSLSRRTVERKLTDYDRQSVTAFVPRARADKGQRKVIISLAAEQSITLSTETWEDIAVELRRYVNGHWKAGETLKMIRGNADFKFRELIEAAGIDCSTFPDKAFIVPRRFIEAERRPLNVLATFQKDRKTYEDNRFRTRRSIAGMMPMDVVIGDVHPVDIVSTREDGSTAHARMIAWQDRATNRLRFDLLLCEPGTGIRNADLIQSFLRMVADPAWGMPKMLYIDNGREYRFADNLNDAMQLVGQLRGDDGRKVNITHARPYNASAKPIEGMFAALEKMLQGVAGHTGGDRMNKKTERVGRPTKAFPGPFERLAEIIQGVVTRMEMLPMRGVLNGRSPRQAYEAAIENGWQPVAVDPHEILTVFADDKVCTIRQQAIQFDNRHWHCEAIGTSYFEKKIIARVPRFWKPDKLALLHVKTRKLIGIAEPSPTFSFNDPAGARFSREIEKRTHAALRVIDRNTPTLDTTQEILRIAAQTPAPTLAAPTATVGISDDARIQAAALAETPERRRNRHQETAEREHLARLAIIEKNLKKDAG